jgi:hypothetical protein
MPNRPAPPHNLLDLDRRVKDLDKQLTDRFEEHSKSAAITSIPGFGLILGAQFLADTGGDLARAFGTRAGSPTTPGLPRSPGIPSSRVGPGRPRTREMLSGDARARNSTQWPDRR